MSMGKAEQIEEVQDDGVAPPTLALRLVAVRKATGLSVRDACKVIGAKALTPAAVYLLEAGKRKHPTTITIEMLARAYAGQNRWRQVAAWVAFGLGGPTPPIDRDDTQVAKVSVDDAVVEFYGNRVAENGLEFQMKDLLDYVSGRLGRSVLKRTAARILRRLGSAGVVPYEFIRRPSAQSCSGQYRFLRK